MYKIFSHNDLDGYSINVLCRFYNIKCEIKNINNKLVDKELITFFESEDCKKYEKIFLCDIYPSNDVAEYIDQNVGNFVLIDHHKTGEHLNKYSWANVSPTFNSKSTCATELFYRYLLNNEKIKENQAINEYVESIRLFDTGDYMRYKYDEKYKPIELSILFFIYFRNYWKHLYGNLKKGYILSFSDVDITTNMNNKISIYSRQKQKELKIIDFEGYKTGVFFIDESIYISKTLMDAHEMNPEIELFMFVNILNSISLRNFGDFNVAKIAEKYGGGGHEMAAGFPYSSSFIYDII